MSELPDGIAKAEPATPRDSASGIVVRHGATGSLEVLLGLRARRARFMPGNLAFPGGAVDAEDGVGAAALARCVAREMAEETGLEIPATEWIDAGERTTPAMFPIRFRARFFVARCPAGWEPPVPPPSTEEIESLTFASPSDVLETWRQGKAALPPPVVAILRCIAGQDSPGLDELVRRIVAANEQEQRAPRIEFAPEVWMLPVRSDTLPPATHTNVWMPGAERFVLIDPGSSDEAENARLLEVVERRRQLGSTPHAVLLTHGHQDHASGSLHIARELGIPLLAHPDAFDEAPTQAIDEGTELDLGGATLRALFTPGHAPGHLAFWWAERKILFAGDLISGTSTILIDPELGDMQAYVESLRRVRRLRPRMVCPGHGPPLPSKALGRLIEHRTRREARVVAALSPAGVGLPQIAREAYEDVPQMPAVLTERQTLSHLIHLERQSRARAVPDAGLWAAVEEDTPRAIERILRERFEPSRFELIDDSAQHVGHAGASSGGGHYRVLIISDGFAGSTRLEQHRQVHEALGDLIGTRIHALALTTRTPAE